MKLLPIIIAATLLSGCVTRTIVKCPTIPEPPPRPVQTAIEDQWLECLSDEAVSALDNNELLLIEYAESLEADLRGIRNACR